jgi:hypothetical protein
MVRNADGMQLVAYWPIAVSRPPRFLLAFIESIFSPAGRIRFACRGRLPDVHEWAGSAAVDADMIINI